MPNADSECNSQQTIIENSLKAGYCCHFDEIGRKLPLPRGGIDHDGQLRRSRHHRFTQGWRHFPNRLCNPISEGLWNRPSLPELRAKSTKPIEISYPTAIWDENS
jgi:hypothetical protein